MDDRSELLERFRPHRTHCVHRCGLFVCMSWRSVVCVSVCPSVFVRVFVTRVRRALQKRLNWLTCRLGQVMVACGTMY